jgi:cytidine deaminase
LFTAIAQGVKTFSAIYIVADTEKVCPPCGACRQVLWDLAGDIDVVMINKHGQTKSAQLHELLPEAFDNGFFEAL